MSIVNGIFIPSPEIRVRIVSTLSRKALYDHPRNNSIIQQIDMTGVFDDQWFQIYPGKDANANLYRIRSEYTNKAIFMNRNQVGSFDFNNTAFADQWFKLEPGPSSGKNAGTFRIVCPATNAVLFSRDSAPFVGYTNAGGVFDDQYFSFLAEDLDVQKIEYQLNAGKIFNTVPKAISSQKATNQTSETQTRSVTLTETIESESTFEHEFGVKLGASATVSVGIPLIAEAEITVSSEVSTTLRWGEKTRTSKAWSDTVNVSVGPHKTYKVYATARQSSFDVPFTVTWKSKKTGATFKTKGVYKGVSVYDFESTWKEI